MCLRGMLHGFRLSLRVKEPTDPQEGSAAQIENDQDWPRTGGDPRPVHAPFDGFGCKASDNFGLHQVVDVQSTHQLAARVDDQQPGDTLRLHDTGGFCRKYLR